jgi:hypothetical protein
MAELPTTTFQGTAGTWALAETLGGAALVELIFEETHTCYLGIRSRRYDWGYGWRPLPRLRPAREGLEEVAGDTRAKLRSPIDLNYCTCTR